MPKKTKKIVIYSCLVFLTGILVAMIGGFFKVIGEFAGITSTATGGNYSVKQTMGKGTGVTKMSGGNYAMEGGIIVGMASKLENNLEQAHCYPNPYKPSRGHTKITFARLTNHTKLKIYNIAGEFVYDDEQDTPDGELPWDVVNNDGDKLASGVYIYLITDNAGNKAKGRFAVIK